MALRSPVRAAVPSLVAFVLCCGVLAAQEGTSVARLKRLVATAEGKFELGVVASRLDEATPYFASNAAAPLTPASNQKVLTCAAAALLLGMESEIRTEFIAGGAIVDGVLKGPLRVRGEGDPTFGAADFGDSLEALRRVAERLSEKGLKRVEGGLLLDDSAFDAAFVGPDWPSDAPTARWMAPSAALSLDEGLLRVLVKPGRGGEAPEVAATPGFGYATIVNKLRTTDKRKDVSVAFERTAAAEFTVKGAVRSGGGAVFHDVAVDDPVLLFGKAFLRALREAGVDVVGGARRAAPEERKGGDLLLVVKTPLSRVFPRLLKDSQNHRAEMVFRHLGYKASGVGSFEAGGAAVKKALASAGVPTDGLSIFDGSGLSRSNRTTAAALHDVLKIVALRPFGESFRDMLAEPTESGTLERRLTELKERLFAKTGTLNGVTSLSGYVAGRDGRWTVFAVLASGAGGAAMRKLVDDLVLEMAKS